MALQDLALPRDIPWRLVAYSPSMMGSLKEPFPAPVWRNSLAIFAYDPDPIDYAEDYPNCEISYLKLVCTITGHEVPEQPDLEVLDQQEIRHRGLPELSRDDLRHASEYRDRALDALAEAGKFVTGATVFPCSGALVQVAINPRSGSTAPGDQAYFVSMQPQHRELVELVTESGESAVTSKSATNIRKGLTTVDSQEDKVAVGAKVQAGNDTANASVSAEWSRTNLNRSENVNITTTDSGRDQRESNSHTTSLSQLYHLLTGFHLGTNRAAFYLQPRPHTVQSKERFTFVNGPQELEGIQEFFFVVLRPKGKRIEDYSIDALLLTAHHDPQQLASLIYESKTDETPWLQLFAAKPRKKEPNDKSLFWKILIPFPIPGISDPKTITKAINDAGKAILSEAEEVMKNGFDSFDPNVQPDAPAILPFEYTVPRGWRVDRSRGLGGYDLWVDPNNFTGTVYGGNGIEGGNTPNAFVDILPYSASENPADYRPDAVVRISAYIYPTDDKSALFNGRVKIYLIRDERLATAPNLNWFAVPSSASSWDGSKYFNPSWYSEATPIADEGTVPVQQASGWGNAGSLNKPATGDASTALHAASPSPAAGATPELMSSARVKTANGIGDPLRNALKSAAASLAFKKPKPYAASDLYFARVTRFLDAKLKIGDGQFANLQPWLADPKLRRFGSIRELGRMSLVTLRRRTGLGEEQLASSRWNAIGLRRPF